MEKNTSKKNADFEQDGVKGKYDEKLGWRLGLCF